MGDKSPANGRQWASRIEKLKLQIVNRHDTILAVTAESFARGVRMPRQIRYSKGRRRIAIIGHPHFGRMTTGNEND
jgi:hypothetical protein